MVKTLRCGKINAQFVMLVFCNIFYLTCIIYSFFYQRRQVLVVHVTYSDEASCICACMRQDVLRRHC